MTGPRSPQISTFRGILLGTLDQYVADQPEKRWQLCDGLSRIDCLIPSTDLLHELLSGPITTCRLQVANWSQDGVVTGDQVPVLTSAWPDDAQEDDSLYQLPMDICPAEGVFMGVLELIETLNVPPLYRMMVRIFREREVVDRYWTTPASARHHHAFPGGLAAHSLEVARDLASQSSLDRHERELCVAAGLLHDIGKLWSYTPDMFLNTAARAMGHELIGLSRLERELKVLEGEWPDGAYALRVVLSGCGRMRQDGSMPSALVARLKAADQRSCEQERSRKKPGQTWTPRSWLPSLPPLDLPRNNGAELPDDGDWQF